MNNANIFMYQINGYIRELRNENLHDLLHEYNHLKRAIAREWKEVEEADVLLPQIPLINEVNIALDKYADIDKFWRESKCVTSTNISTDAVYHIYRTTNPVTKKTDNIYLKKYPKNKTKLNNYQEYDIVHYIDYV